MLQDRTTTGTAEWLGQHPEVEIISRDRCGLYAQGAREGAPQARQVADRFRLLQNLPETIETQLSRADRSTGRSLVFRIQRKDFLRAAVVRVVGDEKTNRTSIYLPMIRRGWKAGLAANSPQKLVWRVRIVLLWAQGAGVTAIVRATGKTKRTAYRGHDRLAPRRTLSWTKREREIPRATRVSCGEAKK